MIAAAQTDFELDDSVLLEELDGCFRAARAPVLRSMQQFAEEEINVTNGPRKGPFRVATQPFARLWFMAVALGLWNIHAACGPTQSGKTLVCFVIPTLYHLFEIEEDVICMVPKMEMAFDKWKKDILPVILKTRYADLLPTSGAGSKGGDFDSITFKNGITLKFMSGGGDDKTRAGYTARVVVITEVDGMDEAGKASREADKVTQVIARTLSFGDRFCVYMECTVSIDTGRITKEYRGGTESRIGLPCPHCRAHVTPEREHFLGWQGATNAIEAGLHAAFFCPDCGQEWTAEQRIDANQNCRLLHRDQTVNEAGEIIGEIPQTRTLGFRWTAANNLLVTPAFLGEGEYLASIAEDEENAEKERRQFFWVIPYKAEAWQQTPLDVQLIIHRVSNHAKGHVPAGTVKITVGCDLGKWLCHWFAIAWTADGSSQVIAYDTVEVKSQELDVKRALLIALREFRETMLSGFEVAADQPNRIPDKIFIDAGYLDDVVYVFCRETEKTCGRRFMPSIGVAPYYKPKETNDAIKLIGEGYHIKWDPTVRLHVVIIDPNRWKSFVHERLTVPLVKDKPEQSVGAMLLHKALPNEHLGVAKHLTSERMEEEFIAGHGPGKGLVKTWVKIRSHNHWLDAAYLACGAGHLEKIRIIPIETTARRVEEPDAPPLTTPDGRPFLISERSA